MHSSIGERMKGYEAVFDHRLPPKVPVIVRVDGRAFHSYSWRRPFDERLIDLMQHVMGEVAREIQGFRLAYTQSDEISFLLTDLDQVGSQAWFGNEINKLCSITASAATAHFNTVAQAPRYFSDCTTFINRPALFDARAYSVPMDDVPNVFVWRQRDWERNSLSMFARRFYSQSDLKGKKRAEVHQMLHDVGQNWADLPPDVKNGTFLTRNRKRICEKANYDTIRSWALEPPTLRGDSAV